jgi:hypothetical protein
LAQVHLESLLQKEPDYKRGEASLLYGKVLFGREKWSLAKEHLDRDVKYWGHAESFILLAKIAIYDGDLTLAREYLQTMLARVNAAPQYSYRMKQHLAIEVKKLA